MFFSFSSNAKILTFFSPERKFQLFGSFASMFVTPVDIRPFTLNTSTNNFIECNKMQTLFWLLSRLCLKSNINPWCFPLLSMIDKQSQATKNFFTLLQGCTMKAELFKPPSNFYCILFLSFWHCRKKLPQTFISFHCFHIEF